MQLMQLIWFLFLYFIPTFALYAKLPDIPVTTKIGQNQLQLPDKLLQTEQGLWISDESGLYRVTGNKYLHFNSSNSPIEGSVTELIQDEFDNIWIATDVSGILHFNSKTRQFTEIKNISGESIESCLDISLYKNKVYALCNDALIEIDIESVDVTDNILKKALLGSDSEVNKTKLGYLIRQAKVDELGNIWLSSAEYIYRYDIESGKTERFKINVEMPSVNGFPYVLYVDSTNRIWLLGETVLFIEKANDQYQFSVIERECEKVCLNFRTAFEDTSGSLWFAGYSIEKYDEEKKSIFHSRVLSPLFVNDTSYYIYDIEEGESGELYMASNVGVIELPKVSESINFLYGEGVLKRDYVYAEHLSENLIFVSEGPGVKAGFYNLNGSEIYLFNGEYYEGSSFSRYKDGVFLAINEDSKIYEFNIDLNTVENVHHKLKGVDGDIHVSAMSAYKGRVFFSTDDGDLYKGDFDSGFELIKSNVDVHSIYHDVDGNVYFNDLLGGVYRYNSLGGWKYWKGQGNGKKVETAGLFIQDASGRVWIGSGNGGLGYLEESSNDIKYINSTLINEDVLFFYAAVDSQGYLWLVSSINIIRFDPKNNTSMTLNRTDGIEDKEYFTIKNLPSDELFLSGFGYTYIINTKEINHYLDERVKLQHHTLLHDVTVSDKRKSEPVSRVAEVALAGNGSLINITHNEYIFTIEFAVNSFIERNNFGFEYRLLGLSDEWINVEPQEGSATYSTLPDGDYTFEVRAVDKRSIVEQPITRLDIKVLPPYWLTWQAYSLYILVLLSLFYFIYRYRTQQLKQMNIQLETSVAERTAELASSNAHVSNLLKQKETLFANVSHEFRTPLTLISGPLEKLHKKISDDEGLQYFDIMQRNTQRLTQLVEQILDLSHLETAITSEKQLYDIEIAIPILVESFKPLALHKEQALILNHHCLGGLELTKDALEKILLNLLSNAIKYTPPGGTITIVVEEIDKHFCMRVTDTGSGISAGDLKKIFERFTRLENSDNEMGSGLGLALVKELVNTNNGQINVVSTVGKGTTFTVMFPLVSDFDRALVSPLSEGLLSVTQPADIALNEQIGFVRETDGTSEKPTVLIIEDNKDMRSFIQQSLQESYRCLTASDGQEGIDLAIEHVPDLILSDLMMPVKDGFEVVDSIRQNELSAHIPIILLTARGDDKSRLMGWQKAVDDYIPKPFNVDELLLRIARLISIRDIVKKRMRQAAELQVENSLTTEQQESIASELSFDYPKDHVFFDKLIGVIKSHYSDESFGRTIAAKKLAVSERQLNRKLSALVDYNFNELLRRFRLERAKELIKSGEQIGSVCYEVGFTSPSYFSRCFKAEFGCSPKELS
jgi:signal transduction histidine kinase/DNA-binding response OmpR family regulator/ligand-binding sensor domain-containing protein